ncbi:efflux RND transporter permease subunit [Treponema parvum]|uniref:Efflux RND transporter permease subunit n=1 Tax=Treponema parvum TaxID=138851 RepID=A0A975F1P0_9SPIR|nr:efflux RND transporter permease subunit [Treponema parvum]QTQ12655.1 efflux RND transporter permease subunit [Treponema parvum]
MSISKKTLEHPVLTLIIFVLLGVMGLFTLKNVAISLFPDVDFPMIWISTSYKNAGPESVEKSVTKVLESSLVSVNGLKNITSSSSESSSSISLEFEYGTDLDVATNDIRDKIDRVKGSLPGDAGTPAIFKIDSNSMPIMRIAVRGNRSNDDLKEIAENSIVDVLEQTNGVAEASVSGGREKIVRVELSQNRLAAYKLNISSVISAISKQNLELGGGKINEGTKDFIVRTTGEYSSIDDINNAVITTVNGYDVKLSDLGTAFEGYQDRSSEVYINGEEGVYVSVTKQSGTNSVTVANAVYEKLDQLKKTLPSDISLDIIMDDTTSIRDTISTLLTSLQQGLVLAVFILFVFLCNFKSTIIIAVSIPLSMIITLLAMHFAGLSLNMMTMTGLILGLGMVVDASIVMIENIYGYRQRGTKPVIAAVLGSQEMIVSVVSGNLTTICVFLPFLLFISELQMMGQMFKGIIFTVVIALVSSLFVAIFLVPVLAGKFLPLSNRTESPVRNSVLKRFYSFSALCMDNLTAAYKKALTSALNHRPTVIICSICALFLSITALRTMHINMMPHGNDDSVTLNITMPIGTNLKETTLVVQQWEEIVKREVKGYKNLITSIGTGGRRSSSGTTYKGSISIRLPETKEQIDTAPVIQQKLRQFFNDFPDAQFSFSAGMARQMAGDDLDIAIRSDDLNTALQVADQIKEVMDGIEDIGEASIDTEKGLPQVEIVIDRPRAYSFGVDVTSVANEIYYAIDGYKATTYRKNGNEYEVEIMLRPDDRAKITDLESIYVKGKNGLVSVANFASIKRGLGPVSINREDQSRIVHVTADIVSAANANVVEQMIKDKVSQTFVVPDNVTINYEGSWQDIQKQGSVYGLIILLAIILVFGVMAGTYESFKAPIINLTTIPFLIIGVVFIYKLTGQALSIMSMIGVIMLVGIVVNNGIILVDYTNLLIDRGLKMKDACIQAGSSRLRPILMTTLTTILGMLPMCFATEGMAAVVQPIGLAVVGGLASSTFVTLFFIPVLYSLIMNSGKIKHGKIQVLLSGETDSKKGER